MRKERHTEIWKELGEATLDCLEFLSEEYQFSKPQRSCIRDESYYVCSNGEVSFSATIYDGQTIPPRFGVKENGNHWTDLCTLPYGEKLEHLRSAGFEKSSEYFQEVNKVIRQYL